MSSPPEKRPKKGKGKGGSKETDVEFKRNLALHYKMEDLKKTIQKKRAFMEKIIADEIEVQISVIIKQFIHNGLYNVQLPNIMLLTEI